MRMVVACLARPRTPLQDGIDTNNVSIELERLDEKRSGAGRKMMKILTRRESMRGLVGGALAAGLPVAAFAQDKKPVVGSLAFPNW
ncbi:MAG TPA: hypothetical protein VMI56_27090, partial [Reyranella sp.]|nr:hypothetical protein [Reyranella sp.]